MRNEAVEEIFKTCLETVDKKNNDYGKSDDFYFNFRQVENVGIPLWVGVVIRYLDKHSRLVNAVEQFNTTGKIHLENESLEDTLIDGINYMALILATYRDWKNEKDQYK